ncbi:STAS domain-containing protein [Spirillospora sp. NPDC048911]|uniref:STAS domain-containing protein n=1 Tax=Spirillospora sp. NPDC048911 TaxID=3364527 RepID=UPI0037164585
MAAAQDPLASRLNVNIRPAHRWQIVEVGGDLDLVTAPALRDQIGALIDARTAPRIALEMSRLTFCDSSGLNALIRLWKRAVAAGGQLVLLRPGSGLIRMLETTGLNRFLRVVDTPLALALAQH